MQPRLYDPDASPPVDDESLTVADVVRLYLRHAAAVKLHGPDSRTERERTLMEFVSVVGTLAVADAKPFHLSEWIESRESWRSVSTRRSKANQVRAAFNWAFQTERINRNPFATVRYSEAERRPEMPDDLFSFVARVGNKPFESIVRFLRLTGCRLSEACRATWADVDLAKGVWTIHRHKSRRFSGKPKVVALVGEAVSLLRNVGQTSAKPNETDTSSSVVARSPMPALSAVFLNTAGRPWTRRTLGQTWLRLKRKHGIKTDASLHGLRHMHATAAIANGAPLSLVAAQLGHSSPAVTSRYYVHLTEAHLDQMRDAAQLGAPK